MPTHQCNICRRGRIVRAVLGAVFIVCAAMLFLGVLPTDSTVGQWGGGGILAAIGLFCLYEARKSWCAIRALGIKTPI